MPNILIVSGLSGSGKSVALRSLEDSGYYCIDNLPVVFIEPILQTVIKEQLVAKLAIGVDIRGKAFLKDAYQIILQVKQQYKAEVLFLEAEPEVIVRRYKETRRPHPVLDSNKNISIKNISIIDAIEQEKLLLQYIRQLSDKVIDTSFLNPHELRKCIISFYNRSFIEDQSIDITIISFGFKFGIPNNIDLMFDVRFLKNPYFVPQLRYQKGTDKDVFDYVMNDEDTKTFLNHITGMLAFVIPKYINEGKTYLIIGFGCTGGWHRSPAIALRVSQWLKDSLALSCHIIHRECCDE